MTGKKLTLLLAALILISVCSAGCISSADDGSEVYVVGTSPGYPPFVHLDENGELRGIDIESIKWIAEEQGFDIEFVIIENWDSLIPSLLAGKIDMIYAGMTVTPERSAQVTFSVPYQTVGYEVIARTDSSWTMNDFLTGNLKIAVTRGSTAEQWVDRYYREHEIMGHVVTYSMIEDAVAAVNQGKADACIGDNVNLLYVLDYVPTLQSIGSVKTDLYYGVAMRNEHTELHALINEGIEKLISSGTWAEIASRYNFTP